MTPEEESTKAQGAGHRRLLEPFTVTPGQVTAFKSWLEGYLDGTYGTGKRNQSCEVNPQFLAGLMEYQSQEVERLRALLIGVVNIPPSTDKQVDWHCCRQPAKVFDPKRGHADNCPWFTAWQSLHEAGLVGSLDDNWWRA